MEIAMLLITIMVVIIAVLVSRVTETEHPFPFSKKANIFSHAERAFLVLIEKAVGQEYKVISRVRLADLVALHDNLSKRSRQNVLAKANKKYLDYVLCDRETMEVVAAIDLVNITSKNGHNNKKDWFLHGALDASQIPYVRIQIRNGYKPIEIRECIYNKINRRKPVRKPLMKGTEIPANMIRPRLPNKPISTGLIQA